MKQIKKTVLLLLVAVMLFGLGGCAGTKINWNEVPDSTGGKDVERSVGLGGAGDVLALGGLGDQGVGVGGGIS